MAANIKRKRASSSSLFLTELMIAILFFALAATLCITLFVKAHLMSRDAGLLNHALNATSDAAEIIRTSDSTTQVQEQLTRLYPNAESKTTDSGYLWTVFFDDEYYPMDKDHYTLYETVDLTDNNGLLTANIVFFDSNDNEVYRLTVNHTITEEIQ